MNVKTGPIFCNPGRGQGAVLTKSGGGGEQRERGQRERGERGHNVLSAMPKGSASTLFGPKMD